MIDPNCGPYSALKRRVLLACAARPLPLLFLDFLSDPTPEAREAREYILMETERKAAARCPGMVGSR